MRTLKRLMCLVLALVMVLGLCVTSVSAVDATKFPDLKDSKHQEAIKILAALDIVQGENGKLQLDRTLRRAEMASLIYQMIGRDAKFIPKTTFTDVEEGKWYYTPIAFCENMGILSGNGDGTVDPEGPLTGYMLGSMLLGVLGYDRKYELEKMKDKNPDNPGIDWTFVTYTYVLDRDLDAGLSLDYKWAEPIPRDDAFQMMFNALKATMVDYDDNGSFTLPGGGTWVNRGSAKDIQRNENKNSSLTNYAGEDPNAPGYGYLQVCERYWPKLKLSDLAPYDRDDFKRPGHTWFNNNEAIAFIADQGMHYDSGTFTGADAKAMLRSVKNDDTKIKLYYNGREPDPNYHEIGFNDLATEQAQGANWRTALWIDDTTGKNGLEIDVYPTEIKDGDGKVTGIGYEVIIAEAYVAQVTAATKEGNDITVKAYEVGSAYPGTGTVAFANPTQTFTVKKGDELLYNTLAKYPDKAYVAVYLKPTFDSATDGYKPATDAASKWILKVADLTPVDVTITHIHDKSVRVLSKLEVNDGKATYELNNEAIWTNGKQFCANIIKGANDRATKLGAATLYTLDGKVLLVAQGTAASAIHYAYVLDYKAIDKAAGSDQWLPEYDDGGNAMLKLKLKLDTEEVIEIDYKGVTDLANPNTGVPTDIYNGTGTRSTTTGIMGYADKPKAEAVGAYWVNQLVEYRPSRGTIYAVNDYYYAKEIDYDGEPDGNDADPDYGVMGVQLNAGHNLVTQLSIKPGQAEVTMNTSDGSKNGTGTGTPQTLVFDDETTIFVVYGELSARNRPNAEVTIYHGILDEALTKEIKGAPATFVQYVQEKTTGRIVSVLVRQPAGESKTVKEDYFIVGSEAPVLHKMYTNTEHTTWVEYYEFEAVVNGEIETVRIYPNTWNTNKGADDVIWVDGVTVDGYGIISAVGTTKIKADSSNTIEEPNSDYDPSTDPNDPNNMVPGLKWTVLNKVIQITSKKTWTDATHPDSHSYAVAETLPVWLYDATKGTIVKLSIDSIAETMTGYVDFGDTAGGKLLGLYLTIPDSQ